MSQSLGGILLRGFIKSSRNSLTLAALQPLLAFVSRNTFKDSHAQLQVNEQGSLRGHHCCDVIYFVVVVVVFTLNQRESKVQRCFMKQFPRESSSFSRLL